MLHKAIWIKVKEITYSLIKVGVKICLLCHCTTEEKTKMKILNFHLNFGWTITRKDLVRKRWSSMIHSLSLISHSQSLSFQTLKFLKTLWKWWEEFLIHIDRIRWVRLSQLKIDFQETIVCRKAIFWREQ
jgi:hypothetical protein